MFVVCPQGEPADKGLLEALHGTRAGLVFEAAHPGQRSDLLAWFRAGLPSPTRIVRLDVAGASAGGEDLFYPAAWLPGRRLRVMGRTAATDRIELSMTLEQDGKATVRRWTMNVDPQQDDVFLGRLWARRKLERLYQRARPETVRADAPPLQASNNDPLRQQILSIAQEWSLLTPYTAFLVLEGEADYQRWNVDRRMRRRYWRPAEASVEEPGIAGDAYAPLRARLAQQEAARVEAAQRRQFDKSLQLAREAVKAGDYRLADGFLRQVRTFPVAAKTPEYAELTRQAEAHVRRDALLEALGPHRFLLAPPARLEPDSFQASLEPLLASVGNAAFERRHPNAARLLKEVRVDAGPLTLGDFLSFLAETTGLNVVPDRKALADAGIELEEKEADRRQRQRDLDNARNPFSDDADRGDVKSGRGSRAVHRARPFRQPWPRGVVPDSVPTAGRDADRGRSRATRPSGVGCQALAQRAGARGRGDQGLAGLVRAGPASAAPHRNPPAIRQSRHGREGSGESCHVVGRSACRDGGACGAPCQAVLLARHGLRETADRVFGKALAPKDLPPEVRCDLLRGRAEVQNGLARWRSLLAASLLAPGRAPERTREFEQVLLELTAPADAQAAATLARESSHPRMHRALLLRQAELAIDPKVAADAAWELHQTRWLPRQRATWACRTWNVANQPGRTIDLLEAALRRGRALDSSELNELEFAYRAASRPVDAQRAATTPPIAMPPAPGRAEARPMGGGFF